MRFPGNLSAGLALAALATPSLAAAQSGDPCTLEGQRVRVSTVAEVTLVGDVLGCSDLGLQVRPDDGQGGLSSFIDHVIPVADIRAVDVSVGFRRPIARSLAISASLGAVVFGGFAYLTGDDGGSCGNGEFCVRLSRKRKTVAGLIAGAVIGGGGGLVHGLSQEVEIWQPWPALPEGWELSPTVDPERGIGARLVWRF